MFFKIQQFKMKLLPIMVCIFLQGCEGYGKRYQLEKPHGHFLNYNLKLEYNQTTKLICEHFDIDRMKSLFLWC